MREEVSGTTQLHDTLRDEYWYNGITFRTSEAGATILIDDGLVGKVEALHYGERSIVLAIVEILRLCRRTQYRQSPPRPVPKPGAQSSILP